jgi:renalase
MNMDKLAKKCIVIGAGISGVTAAQQLQALGFDVTILDKSRGVGGRMAHRRTPSGGFDHGAQFFTTRDPLFEETVQEWVEAGIAKKWSQGFFNGDSTADTTADTTAELNSDLNAEAHEGDGHPRYISSEGMNAIVKHVAKGLDIKLNQKIMKIEALKTGWSLQTESGEKYDADILLMTAPAPQALDLISEVVSVNAVERLSNIEYAPCITALIQYESAIDLPFPGAIQLDGQSGQQIGWIANNVQKGISETGANLTVQMVPEFSKLHWGIESDEVIEMIKAHLEPWISKSVPSTQSTQSTQSAQPFPAIKSWQIHRWKFSQPLSCDPEHFLLLDSPHPIGFAGDGFCHPRVEGAFLSGIHVAKAIHELSRR